MNVSPGDVLLYAASAKRDMTWETFKRIVNATCVPDGQQATEMKYVRAEAADIGDMLGHWETVHTEAGRRIVVAPPVLARLPWPGLPRAVLCGSRSPDTITDIREVCDWTDGLSLSIFAQSHHPYAPTRIELSGESEEQLAAAGCDLSVHYTSTPAAWSIAQASGSVDDYIKTLTWEENEDLNWDRREFNPDLLSFRSPTKPRSPTASTDLSRLRLVTYSNPAGWDRRDWLWNDNACADVDRSWGRYCVLAFMGRSVLDYNHRDGVATVPRQVPLPKLLARALSLSSGEVPRLIPGTGIGLRAYSSVPQPLFEMVAAKLHQYPRQLLPDKKGKLT